MAKNTKIIGVEAIIKDPVTQVTWKTKKCLPANIFALLSSVRVLLPKKHLFCKELLVARKRVRASNKHSWPFTLTPNYPLILKYAENMYFCSVRHAYLDKLNKKSILFTLVLKHVDNFEFIRSVDWYTRFFNKGK